MKKILLIVLMAMICSPACAQRGDDDNIPKGKVYVYKQVNGVNREMEIYFPKGKKASQKPVAGIILFSLCAQALRETVEREPVLRIFFQVLPKHTFGLVGSARFEKHRAQCVTHRVVPVGRLAVQETLLESYRLAKRNNGAPGIDGESQKEPRHRILGTNYA